MNFNSPEILAEQLILAANWRKRGFAFYGTRNSLPVNYSIAVMNGLNSAAFEHGNGIRSGRPEE